MVSTKDEDRRLYERIPGNGTVARLRAQAGQQLAPILDISRGGVRLGCDWTGEAGSEVRMVLPGTDAETVTRVIRTARGQLGVAFRQDSATLALVDQALRHVVASEMRAAA
jgi:hypothetical protein